MYEDETEAICEILRSRGDQRIGQILLNAISQEVEFEDVEDPESLEDIERVRYKNRAKQENRLWSIDAPELLELLENLNETNAEGDY